MTTALLPTAASDTPSRRGPLPGGRVTGGVLLAILGVAAGIGWLYTIRRVGLVNHGPKIDGTLPLQQLAGSDAQPLARVLVAWVPVALATGAALAWAAGLARVARTVAVGLTTLVTLWVAGAESDAVAINQAFGDHISQQAQRSGLWLVGVVMVLGALLVPDRRRRLSAGEG